MDVSTRRIVRGLVYVILTCCCMPLVPMGLWPAIPALFTIPSWLSWFREAKATVDARRILRSSGAFDA